MNQENITVNEKKKGKHVLVAMAVILIFAGMTLIGIAGYSILMGNPFFRFQQGEEHFETRQFVINEEVKSLYSTTVDYEIEIVSGQESTGLVEYTYWDDMPLTLEVRGETLYIQEQEKKHWFEWFGTSFFRPDFFGKRFAGRERHLYILLPSSVSERLALETVSGNVSLRELSFSSVDLSTVSGDIDAKNIEGSDMSVTSVSGDAVLEEVTGNKLYASAVSGNMTLRQAFFEELMDLNSVSGEYSLHQCDAGEIRAETVSGNIKGEILSDKRFQVETLSGSVNVPGSAGDRYFKVNSVSGNVEITVEPLSR